MFSIEKSPSGTISLFFDSITFVGVQDLDESHFQTLIDNLHTADNIFKLCFLIKLGQGKGLVFDFEEIVDAMPKEGFQLNDDFQVIINNFKQACQPILNPISVDDLVDNLELEQAKNLLSEMIDTVSEVKKYFFDFLALAEQRFSQNHEKLRELIVVLREIYSL